MTEPATGRYIVTFEEGMPSVGPAEVAYAEVLPSGWVMVIWRSFMNSVSYYPSHVVSRVQTPGTRVTLPGEEVGTDDAAQAPIHEADPS